MQKVSVTVDGRYLGTFNKLPKALKQLQFRKGVEFTYTNLNEEEVSQQKAESRKQKAESRKQKAESRKQQCSLCFENWQPVSKDLLR